MATGVKTRHKDYDRFSLQWQRVRHVVAGQDAIYGNSLSYLPPLIDESPLEYKARLERTPFFNATWRTMAAFVGLLFRKAAIIEVPENIKPLLNDVTMSGVDFNSFAQEVALEDIEVSRVGVLVDFPQVEPDPNRTVAQAEAMGLRPSMVMYRAESILNWHYEFINNKTVLAQVRLAETVTIQKSEFEFEQENRVRVLDLMKWGDEGSRYYRQRVFKEENGEQIGGDIVPQMDGAPLDFIPFYIIGPDGGSPEVTEPILIDLVDLNLKHFQVSADYEHGCHFTGLPQPVIIGAQQEFNRETGAPIKATYPIGSTSAWTLPAGADAKYMEFSGQGLAALEKNLERKEAQMAAIGARMLTPEKAGVEAAETLAMRHSGEHSILGAISVAVSQGLLEALKTFCRWAGVKTITEENVKFQINRDFMPFILQPQQLTALLSAVQAGKLSHEAFFNLMQRGDMIDADTTFEDEQARIDANPPMPEPVLEPGGGNTNNPAEKETNDG